jgi:hypothetical protein
VTNSCVNSTKSNNDYVLALNYDTNAFSGFVYEIEASNNYDPNSDKVIYKWAVPANVPVSLTNGPKIRFLSPIVTKSEVIEFTLTVSNGITKQSKSFPVNIMPYKPELYTAKIINAEASNYYLADSPDNITDGNLGTKWSVEGDNQWLLLKLVEPFKINHLQVAFLQYQNFESYFDIYASKDNISWDPILMKATSCNFSGNLQVFDFPTSKKDIYYSFIKLVGQGNSLNKWNCISELKLFGNTIQNSTNYFNNSVICIYPNPAKEFINISVLEPLLEPQIIRIFDLSGKLCMESRLDQGVSNAQIPINLESGLYIVKLMHGVLTLFTQKLIVTE